MTAGDEAGDVVLVDRMIEQFQTAWAWQESAPRVLAVLGAGMAAASAALVMVTEDPAAGLVTRVVSRWTTGESVDPTTLAAVTAGAGAQLIAAVRGGVVVARAADASDPLGPVIRQLGLAEVMLAPVVVSGRMWGAVTVGMREARAWTAGERVVLRIAGRLFGDAVDMAASGMAISETVRRALMEAAADGLVVTDEAGVIVDLNAAASALVGGAALRGGSTTLAALIVAEDGRPVFERDAAGALSAPRAIGRPLMVQVGAGPDERVPAALTLQEVCIADRRLLVANLRDLRPELAAEAEAARQRDRLHAAEKDAALGSLLAGVAHELNNPLAVVVAQTTLLQGKVEGTAFAERVDKIRKAADRCSRIVKGFLSMAKRSDPATRPVDIDDCVRAAVDMTAYGLKSNGIEATLELCGALADVTADPDQVTQIVANLVINAQHALATAPEPRRVRVTTRRDGGRAVVAVEDDGPGVPAAVQARIFEPYFSTKPVGTGIGLSVSRAMALAHGGDLVHEAPPSGGARFLLTLPLPKPTTVLPPPPPRPPRVLVVDDEVDVAASLAEILEMFGARTEVVASAAEGLDAARHGDFAAVFSDLRMPGGGGLALVAAIRAARPVDGPRLALVTGDTVSAAAEVAAAGLADAVTVVEKPFTVADLRRVFAELTRP